MNAPADAAARLDAWLSPLLAERQQQGLLRSRRPLQSQGVQVQDGEQRLLNFSSNDYLGLKQDPRLVEALREAVGREGTGSGSAALVCGYAPAHQRLEEALAEYLGYPAVVLFSSGYLANLALGQTLSQVVDTICQDRLVHASMIDAARATGVTLKRYQHGQAHSLEQQLARVEGRAALMTDGVFSMDGDMAPLAELAALCQQHQACLVVDDAHGLGLFGHQGRGSWDQAGLNADSLPVLVGTFGKAFGTMGAFVAGSVDLASALQQWGRAGIYTTAMPAALAEATHTALGLVRDADQQRAHLKERIHQFREGAAQLGLPLAESNSAIQPLLLGDAQTALDWSARLHERGLLVTAMRPPTVPVGGARLRITLSAAHSADHVAQLLSALEQCGARR